jgi:hypothetical protein
MVLVLHLMGFFAIIIPLWIMAPRASGDIVLLEFTNSGSWSSTGLSAMIGLIAPMAVLVGYDCSVHMCKSQSHTQTNTYLTSFYSRRNQRCFRHPPARDHGIRPPQCHPRVGKLEDRDASRPIQVTLLKTTVSPWRKYCQRQRIF